MCGHPARWQLVPPRRPQATIDTHQAAGGRERPLPRVPLTVVPGPPALRGWGLAGCGKGRPAGGPPVSRPSGSSPTLHARPWLASISLCPSSASESPSDPSLRGHGLGLCLFLRGSWGDRRLLEEAVTLQLPPAPRLLFPAPPAPWSLGVPGDSFGDKAKVKGPDHRGMNEAVQCKTKGMLPPNPLKSR